MSTIVRIPMREAEPYRAATYGVTHDSEHIYEFVGPGLHNRNAPHRIQVWDNTGRTNPRNGEKVRWGERGPIDGGEGRYLDPFNVATDEPVSITTSAEATVITNNGTNTGTVASGQVWAPEKLAVGQQVTLVMPDGSRIRGEFAAKPLHNPHLVVVPGHSKGCLARAIICAVENVRDADPEHGDTLETANFAEIAAGYLADGSTNCYC